MSGQLDAWVLELIKLNQYNKIIEVNVSQATEALDNGI